MVKVIVIALRRGATAPVVLSATSTDLWGGSYAGTPIENDAVDPSPEIAIIVEIPRCMAYGLAFQDIRGAISPLISYAFRLFHHHLPFLAVKAQR